MTQCKFPLSQCGAIILRQHGYVPKGMTFQYLTGLILLLLVAVNPLKTDRLWATGNIYMDKSPLNHIYLAKTGVFTFSSLAYVIKIERKLSQISIIYK